MSASLHLYDHWPLSLPTHQDLHIQTWICAFDLHHWVAHGMEHRSRGVFVEPFKGLCLQALTQQNLSVDEHLDARRDEGRHRVTVDVGTSVVSPDNHEGRSRAEHETSGRLCSRLPCLHTIVQILSVAPYTADLARRSTAASWTSVGNGLPRFDPERSPRGSEAGGCAGQHVARILSCHRKGAYTPIEFGAIISFIWSLYALLRIDWVLFAPSFGALLLLGVEQIALYFAFHPSKAQP
jgi:hypothetical protein